MPTYENYDYPVDRDFGLRFLKAHQQSEYRDLNQEELGKLFNVHKSTISSWTRGVRTPSSEAVKKIALKFKINPDWLYTGREPMRPGPMEEYVDAAKHLMNFDTHTISLFLFIMGLLEKRVITSEQLDAKVKELLMFQRLSS